MHTHKYVHHGQSKQSSALSLKISLSHPSGLGQIICFSLLGFKTHLKVGQWSSITLTAAAFMLLCFISEYLQSAPGRMVVRRMPGLGPSGGVCRSRCGLQSPSWSFKLADYRR